MTLDTQELQAIAPRVEEIAREAGQILMGHQSRFRSVRTEFKGLRELVTAADRESEKFIVERLMLDHPEHAILAEEGVLTPQGSPSKDAEHVWILDPLDGTTNFVHGIPFYCVAICLAYRDEPVLGVIHAPALDVTFSAVRGGGAYRNGERVTVSSTAKLADAVICTGFSYDRHEPGVEDNSARLSKILPLCRDLRRLGSAELDLCLTAAGNCDGFWEMYLQPYDVAAGALLVREAGGRVTDLEGGGDWLHGGQILASNGHLHDEVLRIIGGHPGAFSDGAS